MRENQHQEQADPQHVLPMPQELPKFVCQKENRKEKTHFVDSKILASSQKPARAQKNLSPNKHLKSPGSPGMRCRSPSTLYSSCSKPQGPKSPPLADTLRFPENSLKIKHDPKVRIPPAPSPDAMTNQMHADSKLPNRGKPVNSNASPPNTSPETLCSLGLKATEASSHSGNSSQISPVNSGLKSPENAMTNLGALKGKVKRKRSILVDLGDQRDARTPVIDTKSRADGAPRSKRRCVLERKQPYSGDEWYSGPDSEDEDKPGVTDHNCTVVESAFSEGVQPFPSLNCPTRVNDSSPSKVLHNPAGGTCLQSDSVNCRNPSKPPSQFVYVFTTNLANMAAEAVIQGQSDSIVIYHMHNVPHMKLEQVCKQKKGSRLQEQPSHNTLSPRTHQPRSQQQGQQCLQAPSSVPQEEEVELEPSHSDMVSKPIESNGGAGNPKFSNMTTNPLQAVSANPANGGNIETNNSNGNGSLVINPHGNIEGLSKEQLEHRERSLKTLRDIERLLLRRNESEFPMKGSCDPNGQGDGQQAMKNPVELLQSMISQGQTLDGLEVPNMEQEVVHHQEVVEHDPIGQQVSILMNMVSQENLTSELAAWRKLQEDFYEEKKKKQEQTVVQQRTKQEMMMQQPMMVRGPPPPYHSKAGDQWSSGMGKWFTGIMDLPDSMQPRGITPFSEPRFPNSQIQRVSGYGGMQNIPMEALELMNPVHAGIAWPDDMLSVGGKVHFPHGGNLYHPVQGNPERFRNPGAREELLRQQLMEKRSMSMQYPLNLNNTNSIGGMNQGMEMKQIMQAQSQMESGAISGIFSGQLPGDNVNGSPMGMDLVGSRGMLSPPLGQAGLLHDMDASIGPGNISMNMNVNMNMNMNLNVQLTHRQQMMISQKMRGQEMMSHQILTPEAMARVRAQNGSGMMGDPQKMLMKPQFPNHRQHGFPSGQGLYSSMSQEVTNMDNSGEMFGTEQGTMSMNNMSSVGILSHVQMTPTSNQSSNHSNMTVILPASQRELGRRPSDLMININQMDSPDVGHLKSSTISQVHSALVSSPSVNLKSLQTPSQLPNLSANASEPIKSPQLMSSSLPIHSSASSPSQLKSPSVSVPSPGWTSSTKTTLPSPVITQSKQPMSLNSFAPVGNTEQGPIVSTSHCSPALGLPYNSHNSTASQNPLSLMVSQISKYTMPSSTPLYDDTIKTIATSEDELAPEQSMSMMQPTSISGMTESQNLQLRMAPQSANSPLAMNMVGQPLSDESSAPKMTSPNKMRPNIPIQETHDPGMNEQSPTMMHSAQDLLGQTCGSIIGSGSQMLPQKSMVLQQMQHQPHNTLQSPGSRMHQGYTPGMAMPHEEGVPPHGVPTGPSPAHPQQLQPPHPPPLYLLSQGGGEGYQLSGVASVLNDPELQDVIRPSASGIPEFNLSRIIPSDRPSSTLQYFPKEESQASKASSFNPHLVNLQNMTLSHEQGPTNRSNLPGQRQLQTPPQQQQQRQVVQKSLGKHIFHSRQVPGTIMAKTGMPGQHGVICNSLHQVVMSPQQSPMAQQNMILQTKQRSLSLSGEMYRQGGHMLPSQVGMLGTSPHQSMMFPQLLRQRSASLDVPITFVPGPGNTANVPF
ncbi:B-cell CLL/lymphoma 9-like protein isoform X3 [Hypanus sabinus]|uniref:B-cell CLL/lymphoma 9-like protein isoform X3 n=1 Tax=Hypanus sabinus TaxID=79690 RepID=UPI0028C38604|nr:B-cell CLL/lymphoma 9-like protein isoform X3 [Hypanus sabinus]